MKGIKLIAGENKIIFPRERKFPLVKKIPMKNWVCIYEQNNYNDADYLYQTLIKCSKSYDLTIEEPHWIEMKNYSRCQDWIDSAGNYMNSEYNYKFIIFLLDKNYFIYPKLKQHSLCTNGYVSQVIKVKSLKKNAMNVCSKVLLQINAKLRGVNYKIEFDQNIKDKKLMVIGVD